MGNHCRNAQPLEVKSQPRRCVIFDIHASVLQYIFCHYVSVQDFAAFVVAASNQSMRCHFREECWSDVKYKNHESASSLRLFNEIRCSKDRIFSLNSQRELSWLICQNIKISNVKYSISLCNELPNGLLSFSSSSLCKLIVPELTEPFMIAIMVGCPQITSLVASRIMNTVAFAELMVCCRNLTALDLDFRWSDVIVVASAKLQTLRIAGTFLVDAVELLQKYPMLTTLDISYLPRIQSLYGIGQCKLLINLQMNHISLDDESLISVVQQCLLLRTLNVRGSKITDNGLAAIGMNCNQLTSLNIYGCAGVTMYGLTVVAEGCPALTHLVTTRSSIANQCDYTLQKFSFPRLERVYMSQKNCTWSLVLMVTRIRVLKLFCDHDLTSEEAIAISSYCTILQQFELDTHSCYHPCLSDAAGAVQHLFHENNVLRAVNLRCCSQVTDQALGYISTHAPHLQKLGLGYYRFAEWNKLTEPGLIQLLQCPQLRSLYLTPNQYTIESLLPRFLKASKSTRLRIYLMAPLIVDDAFERLPPRMQASLDNGESVTDEELLTATWM